MLLTINSLFTRTLSTILTRYQRDDRDTISNHIHPFVSFPDMSSSPATVLPESVGYGVGKRETMAFLLALIFFISNWLEH